MVPRSLFKRAIQLYPGISLTFCAKYAAVHRGKLGGGVNDLGRRSLLQKFRRNFDADFLYDLRFSLEDRFKRGVMRRDKKIYCCYFFFFLVTFKLVESLKVE